MEKPSATYAIPAYRKCLELQDMKFDSLQLALVAQAYAPHRIYTFCPGCKRDGCPGPDHGIANIKPVPHFPCDHSPMGFSAWQIKFHQRIITGGKTGTHYRRVGPVMKNGFHLTCCYPLNAAPEYPAVFCESVIGFKSVGQISRVCADPEIDQRHCGRCDQTAVAFKAFIGPAQGLACPAYIGLQELHLVG